MHKVAPFFSSSAIRHPTPPSSVSSQNTSQKSPQILPVALTIIEKTDSPSTSLKNLSWQLSSLICSQFPNVSPTVASLINCYAIPYFVLIENHVEDQNFEYIPTDLQEARNHGLIPQRQFYINLFYTLIDEGNFEEAWSVFNMAYDDQVSFTIDSYLVLLNIFIQQSRDDRICSLLEKMLKKEITPNQELEEIVLHFFEQMLSNPKKTSRLICNLSLKMFLKHNSQDIVKKILHVMEVYQIKVDKLNALIISHNLELLGIISPSSTSKKLKHPSK